MVTTASLQHKVRVRDILNLIRENPGIRYRELSLLTGLCNGVLSYHIMKKLGAINLQLTISPRLTLKMIRLTDYVDDPIDFFLDSHLQHLVYDIHSLSVITKN